MTPAIYRITLKCAGVDYEAHDFNYVLILKCDYR